LARGFAFGLVPVAAFFFSDKAVLLDAFGLAPFAFAAALDFLAWCAAMSVS
jgi:hypothetical protein